MYKKILLAYDGTLEGAIALREGALLAKRCGAKVFLLSVVAETGGIMMSEAAYGGAMSHQVDTYKSVLERGVSRLKTLGLEPVARLVQGEPAPAIGAVATQIAADLVIIGHQKKNALARWLSGSTHAKITDYLTCSVLIARNPIEDVAFEAELAKAETVAHA